MGFDYYTDKAKKRISELWEEMQQSGDHSRTDWERFYATIDAAGAGAAAVTSTKKKVRRLKSKKNASPDVMRMKPKLPTTDYEFEAAKLVVTRGMKEP